MRNRRPSSEPYASYLGKVYKRIFEPNAFLFASDPVFDIFDAVLTDIASVKSDVVIDGSAQGTLLGTKMAILFHNSTSLSKKPGSVCYFMIKHLSGKKK